MRQLAQETGGRAFFPIKVEDLTSVYAQIADELASQYTLGLHAEERQARRRLAPHRRADRAGQRDASYQTGLLRPDRPVNLLPLALYAAAGVAYAIHFARRSPAVGRAATTLLLLGALTHTFAIGMQTMEVRHVPFANPSQGRLHFRVAAGALLPLPGDHGRRTGDGRLHPAHAGRAAGDSRRSIRASRTPTRCSTARGSGCTWRRCSSPTPASRWPACWA